MSFSGKVVIITGASSGIGAATAIAFSKEGAKLSICGRNKERLSETAKECQENGAETEETDFDMMFRILVRAPVFLCKYALPHLKKTKGCVVNVSSVASLCTKIGDLPYQMFKCALNHFTKGFAAECSPFGIRVNSINPAVVMTRFAETSGFSMEVMDKVVERFKNNHPLGIIQPETIAAGIMFLCTSPHITGILLPVDSGFLGTI
ncbi:meso-2,3-butanediol dehydrogenase-like isoform X2 [Styela clava]